MGLAGAVYHSLASPVGLRVTCTSSKVRHLPTTPNPPQDFFGGGFGRLSKVPEELLDFGQGLRSHSWTPLEAFRERHLLFFFGSGLLLVS